MSVYKNAVPDKRIREYLPPERILLAEKVSSAELLCGNTQIQPAVTLTGAVCRIHAGGSLLIDFGVELHGGVRIVNKGAAGRIRLRFGESASEAMGNPCQDHAIHDAELLLPFIGMLEYGNTAFRFVRIDALDSEIELLNVAAVALYRDLKRGGSFVSSDERLNRIWETGAYTLLLNMQDYIYDGVKRDRLVWMGDLHPEIRGILAVFEDTSLIPASLDFVRDNAPLPSLMNGMSSYSLWWIINQYEYFLHSGDLAYLKTQRSYLTGLLNQLLAYVNPDGSEALPQERFLDWPNYDNPAALHAGLQGLFCWALKCGAELLEILGVESSAVRKMYALLLRRVPDCRNSKAAAAMLTLSGIADRTDVLRSDPFRGISTFYGYYMLLAQPTAPALEVIRRYWGGMLDYGATTFWEDFDLEWLKNTSPVSELPVPGKDDLHADFGRYCYKGLRHSLCHGWAAGPTPFLSERVLGVKILAPGCRKISIVPELCGLEFLEGSFPTPFGAVRITADSSGRLDVDAPSEITVVCAGKTKNRESR